MRAPVSRPRPPSARWPLNEVGKPVRGSKVAILGVSYKAGIGDIRESPALKILDQLAASGARLAYHDVHVPELTSRGLVHRPLEDVLDHADVIAVVTAHPGIDYEGLLDTGVPVVVSVASRAGCSRRICPACSAQDDPRSAETRRTGRKPGPALSA